MSGVIQAALPASSVEFRSIRPRRRKIWIPDPHRPRRSGHWLCSLRLVAHVAMTAFVFLSLVVFVWTVSLIFSLLQSTKPFSADALHVFELLERILIRLDAAACGVAVFVGVIRYILKVVKGDS